MNKYYTAIDGIRAIAVVSVVLYHLNQDWIPGGFVGVDIFFVISGFVVALASRNIASTGFRAFVVAFYARRILRIAPALVVCLVMTTLLSSLFIPTAWLSDSNTKTGYAAFFGVSNFILARTANDYFSPVSEFNPFTHTWSLGVEEQFYLFFPFIYLTWLAASERSWWRNRGTWLLILLSVLSICVAAYWARYSPVKAFYLLPARFWELGIGVGLYFGWNLWFEKLSHMGRGLAEITSWILVGGLVISIFFADAKYFPMPWALLPAICTAGLIAQVVCRDDLAISRALSFSPVAFIGKISYSLYLWHWPTIVLFRWTVGIEELPVQLFALALALVLSVLSYSFVERPLRESFAVKRMTRGRIVALGLVSTLACTGAAAALVAAKPAITLSVTQNADWNPDNVIDHQPGDCAVEAKRESLEGGFIYSYNPVQCGKSSAKKLFAIGDSHAMGYGAMLQQYAARTGTAVLVLGKGGCAIFNLRYPNSEISADCGKFSRSAIDWIKEKMSPGDMLFLPSLRVARLRDQWGGKNLVKDELTQQRLRRESLVEATNELQQFRQQGALILVEAPKPIFRAPPFRCADWFNRMNPVCSDGTVIDKAEILKIREPAIQAIRELEKNLNVAVWDPLEVLCPGDICSPYLNERPLFFDGDHLSAYGNAFLTASFTSAADALYSAPRK